ncbi:DNA-protecting protein DprA [Thalassococcus profundi]|uniref:DNA-protecting protein DprA n=1 Tax=Thalassococcus profundi TaxID=2282382 RepID=A0A369TLB8_9RHOB|nr:DNA-processing protein DprA [Thalassococcus profundi]RDD65464.1 DNA-protecting protein DprA [Thalassococcus profundi]
MTADNQSSTHPLLPPTSEDIRFDWLRLLRSRRVGISTFYRLMAAHGSAAAALAALPDIAAAAGVSGYEICPEGVVAAELKAGRQARARLLCRGDPDYPAALLDLEDAPPLLWAIGDASVASRPMVALVGARNASSLGLRMAKALARGLGEAGCIVVSGLARGIDAAAHGASLGTGTLAVMGGGVDVLYPSENSRLAEDIVHAGGLRLSEQPMGLAPQARHFPARNRLISGLAQAVVVVEAAPKSGSLITARCALDQGREVLAVPGHPFDSRAAGCNMLLRDGARLVRNAEDVLESLPDRAPAATGTQPALDLPPPASVAPVRTGQPVPNAQPARDRRSPAETFDLHRQILARLGPSPLAEDQLIRDIAAAPEQLGSALVDLELEGRIARQPGGLLAKLS